ncbi:MAG: ceramidase [Planctomycetia bacterium]|nr:ceramidase [Planctomycetia bacterium]
MPDTQQAEPPATQPDWGLVTNGRMRDLGPRYIETPPDPYAPDAPIIAEPWNTVTATFFIWIALYWLWQLRGRYREFPFLCTCMPILLAGGVGGTFFHATRVSKYFFLLDVVPISLLGILGSVYVAYRLWGRGAWWLFLPGVAVFYFAVNRLFFRFIGPVSMQLSINLSYASLALVVLTPIVLMLIRTRFRYGGWVVGGLVSFAIAWMFRLIDRDMGPYLSMGSHWLWHTFGAITTALVIYYFYKVEGEKVEAKPNDERREDTVKTEDRSE